MFTLGIFLCFFGLKFLKVTLLVTGFILGFAISFVKDNTKLFITIYDATTAPPLLLFTLSQQTVIFLLSLNLFKNHR